MNSTLEQERSVADLLRAARDAYRERMSTLASELLDGAVEPDDLPYEEALAIVARWGMIPKRTFSQLGTIWTHLYLLLRSDQVSPEQAQEARDNVALILPGLDGMIAVLRGQRLSDSPR